MKITNSQDIDHELVFLEKQLKLLWHLKPVNLQPEKILFLEGKRRNPVFHYPELKFSPEEFRKKIGTLKPDSTPIGMLLTKKIEECVTKVNLLEARGNKRFSDISATLYGAPEKIFQHDAEQILHTPHRTTQGHTKYTTEEVYEILKATLASYGLTRWHVRIKDQLLSDIAAGKRNSLFLLKGSSFTKTRLDRIIAHEIETHILTAENGKYQPYQLFHRGCANYLETQEGLAMYAQECQAECLPLGAHRVSYLTLAVLKASTGSFREVFEMMRSFRLSPEKSFRMAIRAKRGFTDTNEPGAFTKDLLYLKGYRRVEEFAKNGGDLKKLFIGKVALEDLPFFSGIPDLRPPRHLPRWLTGA